MTTQSSTADPTAIKPCCFAIGEFYREGFEAGVLAKPVHALCSVCMTNVLLVLVQVGYSGAILPI